MASLPPIDPSPNDRDQHPLQFGAAVVPECWDPLTKEICGELGAKVLELPDPFALGLTFPSQPFDRSLLDHFPSLDVVEEVISIRDEIVSEGERAANGRGDPNISENAILAARNTSFETASGSNALRLGIESLETGENLNGMAHLALCGLLQVRSFGFASAYIASYGVLQRFEEAMEVKDFRTAVTLWGSSTTGIRTHINFAEGHDFQISLVDYVAVLRILNNTLFQRPRGLDEVNVNIIEGNKDTFRIRVEDNGPGLETDNLSEIFSGYSTKSSGKGFGLMMANEIVKLRGGHIAVTSGRGNRGPVYHYSTENNAQVTLMSPDLEKGVRFDLVLPKLTAETDT